LSRIGTGAIVDTTDARVMDVGTLLGRVAEQAVKTGA